MDHIPTPRAPRYEPPEVLCYARADFSCSGSPSIYSYPESRNWKHRTFIDGDFRQGHTEGESREFLQEWLYFKFLAAVFASVGIEIDMDDFTRLKDGQLLINSTNLIRYISKFEGHFPRTGTASADDEREGDQSPLQNRPALDRAGMLDYFVLESPE